jgi:hypothetical protein
MRSSRLPIAPVLSFEERKCSSSRGATSTPWMSDRPFWNATPRLNIRL